MKKIHGRTVAVRVLAALTYAASVIAGCRPGMDPNSPESVRCGMCIGTKCAAEVKACDTDSKPSTSGDGKLCGCLLGARGLGYTRAESLDHCGMPDDLYKALESCIDDNYARRCPLEPEGKRVL